MQVFNIYNCLYVTSASTKMSDLIIYKHNELIDNFIFNATESELQILNYAVAITNPSWETTHLVYQISVSELVSTFKTKSKNSYKLYREALERLMKRDYVYKIDNKHYKENLIIRTATKDDDNDWLEFKFNEYISQRISNLQGIFTKYDIKHIAMFKSRYAFMLYEFCKMNLRQINKDKEFSKSFTIQDFKERLDIADKYPRFSNLETDVLARAKENINKHSDIKFSYRVKRKGRTPVAITLIAKYKIDSQMLKPENFELVKEVETIATPYGSTKQTEEDKKNSKKNLDNLKGMMGMIK
jgi:plasmid replication initiation protein